MRVFVAIDPPLEVKKQLSQIVQQLKGVVPPQAVKWVEEENFHLTLAFLGEQPEEKIALLGKILRQTASFFSSFEILLTHLGGFPNLIRPRVIWIGVGKGKKELSSLHQLLFTNLHQAGFAPDPRFSPHITLGRIKKGWQVKGEILVGQKLSILPLQFACHQIGLYQSKLSFIGPTYTLLTKVKLKDKLKKG